MSAAAPVFERPLAPTPVEWSREGFPRPRTASGPAWMDAFREKSKEAFFRIGLPNPKDDAWKHMGLEAFLKQRRRWTLETWRLEIPAGTPGLEVDHWSRLKEPPRNADPAQTSGAFRELNGALFGDALMVRARPNVCCLQPIRLAPAPADSAPTEGWMAHPRASIVLEQGSRLDVVVDCGRLPAASGWMNWVMDIELHEQTALNLVLCGPTADQALVFADLAVRQRRDSVFRAFCLETRPCQSRVELSVSLEGENASADLFGLALLGGESRAYHHLRVDHRVPHTQSQEIFKSVLSGSGRFEYDSLVTIHPEAPHASSEQLNKNLLLSDNARAYARPQLAIHTDEVQCHHGATVGQMNADELFYLRTRGLDPVTASELMLRGFVDDLLREIPVSSVAAELQQRSRERLEEIAR